MQKFLFSVLFSVMALVGAVLVAPNFISWNEYRDVIANKVYEATGINLEIRGDIRLGVLPSPVLLVNDVRVANIEGAMTADTLVVDTFEMHISLAPLIARRLQISEVKLVNPRLSLEVLSDGRTNMTFKKPVVGQQGFLNNEKLEKKSTNKKLLDTFIDLPQIGPLSIRVDNFAVQNGFVTYRNNKKQQVEQVESLNGRLSFASLLGPMKSSGSAVIRGVPINFSGSTGSILKDRTLPFSFQLESIKGGTNISFLGALIRIDTNPILKGKLKINAKNLSRLLSSIDGGLHPLDSLNHHFSAVTSLEVSKKGGALKDLSLKLDQAIGVGKISFDQGDKANLKIKLSVNKLDIDSLTKVNVVKENIITKKDKGVLRATSGKNLLSGIQTKLATDNLKFGLKLLPQKMNASLDLSFAAIIYNKAVIRQARVNATLEEKEITISQASALLPGGTDLGVQGMIFHDQEINLPVFDGTLDLATNNLRVLLNWFGTDIPNVPNNRLRKLTVGGKVKATQKKLFLQKVLVQIDGTRIRGALDMVMRKRPIFRIKLAVDQLNLDGYLLKDKSITQPSKPLIIKPASAQLNTERGKKILKKEILPTFFIPKNIDVNLNMKFNNFVAERTMFNGITLRAQISNGRLNLSKLRIANVAGMTVNVSGKIRQSQKTLGLFENEFENLSFNVRGKSPQRILSILNIKPPISARKIGALEISGNLRGKPSSFKILANLSLFGGVYGLDGTVEPLRKLPRISGKFSIRHPNLKMLVNKLGVLYQPTKKDIGPIKLGGNLDGTTELINFSGLSGEIGGVKIKGDVVAKFDERSPRINADLKTGVIILDNFLGAEKNIPSKLSSLDIKNRKYQEFSNRSLFTNASFNGLSREKTSHPMFIRSVTKILAIGAPWKSEPIDFSFLRGFSGDIKLRTKRLRIKNYTIDDIDLKSLCTDGVIDLKRLTGRMYDGTIELDGRLIAKEANSQIKTRFKVINANTGKLLSSLDTRGFRKGALDIASEFRTQGSSTLDFIRALNGGGTISIRGLEFDSEAKKGSPLSGFANLFFSLQQFSGVILGKKSISKRTNFNTNFRTEKGIIRFEDMTIKTGFGNGAAKGSVDLSNWRINTTGEIELSKNVFAQLFLKNIDKPKLLPFKIKGRLDNPNVKLETVALTKGGIVFPSIVNKKLDGLVRKKGVNKILENLFPQNDPNNERIKNNERKPTIPKKPKDYHNKRVNTKDVLKGILRELAR